MLSMPSTTSVISAYTAFAASAMLARSMVSEFQSMAAQLIPQSIRDKFASKLVFLFGNSSSEMTLIIDEHFNGLSLNEVYEASHLYLQEKISPWNQKLKVTKAQGEDDLSITVNKGEEIVDFYQGIKVRWVMLSTESQKTHFEYEGSISSEKVEHRSFELSFSKKHKEVILGSYLSNVMEFAKKRKEVNRAVKLQSLGGGHWGSINLNHPSTFDTLAMDPSDKRAIMDDLDRFVRRREYYRRVGKAWKRGYLLYGPPGTGKSSLIAAMANYLKFNIYDVELTSIRDNMSLRSMLVSTENRSIIVIEDIDCSVELQNRLTRGHGDGESGLTLSGLLNFIDGLWSSCGDERIIVFTTNYKEKLDPALLRPGRMDMHIHMSYLTPTGFRVLAFNYLGVTNHPLFAQIERLISELEITPATVAEELMKDDDDPNSTLELLLESLQKKKSKVCESDVLHQKEEAEETIEHVRKAKATKCEARRRSSRKRKSAVPTRYSQLY
ncbi:hypothetical protein V2J09_013182 [Rumex salicifolius]